MIKTITKITLFTAFALSHTLNFAQQVTGEQNVSSRFNYARPSLTEVYLKGGIRQEDAIYDGFTKLKKLADDCADHNNLNFPKIENSISHENKDYQEFLSNSLQYYFNKLVAMWWSRDSNGNMSDEFIKERGKYAATDGQVVQDNNSEITRIGDLGYRLIEKTYIIVYDITSVQNMEDYYNEKDTKERARIEEYNKNAEEFNKKLKKGEKEREKKKFVPIQRVKQGWTIGYNYSLYKLVWNSEIEDEFIKNFWVDQNTTENRNARIQSFNAKDFQFQLVNQWESSIDQTKKKNHTDPVNADILNELLLGTGETVQKLAMMRIKSKVDDFKLRANIYSAYPIEVKLGTKEGLKKETRYFVYDMVQNKKGEFVKRRVGWSFVTKVAENKQVANGVMPTSKFQQHGGKKFYSGMLIEERNDFGLALTIANNFGNAYLKGYNIGAEVNLSKITSMIRATPKFISNIHGLYLGVNLSFSSSNNVNLGHLTLTNTIFIDSISPTVEYYTNVIADSSKKYSTSTYGLNFTLGKEFYVYRGIYLYPNFGLGINGFSIDKRDGKDIYFSKQNKGVSPFDFSGFTAFGSLRVGYNVVPWVNVFTQIYMYSKKGVLTNDNKFVQAQSKLDDVNHTFRSLDKAPLLWGAGIRIRL